MVDATDTLRHSRANRSDSASMCLGRAYGIMQAVDNYLGEGEHEPKTSARTHAQRCVVRAAALAEEAATLLYDAPDAMREAVLAAQSMLVVLAQSQDVHPRIDILKWGCDATSNEIERAKALVDDPAWWA